MFHYKGHTLLVNTSVNTSMNTSMNISRFWSFPGLCLLQLCLMSCAQSSNSLRLTKKPTVKSMETALCTKLSIADVSTLERHLFMSSGRFRMRSMQPDTTAWTNETSQVWDSVMARQSLLRSASSRWCSICGRTRMLGQKHWKNVFLQHQHCVALPTTAKLITTCEPPSSCCAR